MRGSKCPSGIKSPWSSRGIDERFRKVTGGIWKLSGSFGRASGQFPGSCEGGTRRAFSPQGCTIREMVEEHFAKSDSDCSTFVCGSPPIYQVFLGRRVVPDAPAMGLKGFSGEEVIKLWDRRGQKSWAKEGEKRGNTYPL